MAKVVVCALSSTLQSNAFVAALINKYCYYISILLETGCKLYQLGWQGRPTDFPSFIVLSVVN